MEIHHRGARRHGSPAHAGIDLKPVSALYEAVRIPRTRGDRPQRRVGDNGVAEDPPHTRG